MPVMHTVVGIVLAYLFVTHFFDKSSEHWATRDHFCDVSPLCGIKVFRDFHLRVSGHLVVHGSPPNRICSPAGPNLDNDIMYRPDLALSPWHPWGPVRRGATVGLGLRLALGPSGAGQRRVGTVPG